MTDKVYNKPFKEMTQQEFLDAYFLKYSDMSIEGNDVKMMLYFIYSAIGSAGFVAQGIRDDSRERARRY